MPRMISGPRPSDRWIPWYFVAFFTVLTLVLVPMCIIAVRTNTGIVTENPYEKGLAYNKSIAADEQQRALGWHGDVSVRLAGAPDTVMADFVLKDKAGKLLSSADVTLWLVRPTQAGMDQKAAMNLQPNGHYAATLKVPAHGLWEARVAAQGEEHNFQMTKRVEIP